MEAPLFQDVGYLRAILNAVQTGILMIDAETHRIVYANPTALQVIGRPKEQVIGAVCHRFICPAVVGKCPITGLGQTVDNSERVVIDARGEGVPVLKTVVPTVMEGRRYLIESFLDITARKQSEKALHESEEKYRTLVENAADFIFMIDGKTRTVLSVNRSAARPFGKEPEEIQGKSIFELFPKEIAAEYAESINEVLKTGRSKIYESKMVAGGREVWISTSLNPLSDLEGKKSSVLGVSRDITERKQAEAAMRESEARYRTLFDNANDALYFHDGEGNWRWMEDSLRESERRFRELADLLPQIVFETDEKGVLTFVNRVGLLSLGYTEEDLRRGFDAFQAFPPEDARRAMENMRRVMRGEQTGPHEYSLLRKDGTPIPIIIYSSAIIRQGKPVGWRGIIVDITERKQMEAHLAEAQRLAAIGETTTMVGHDLRNPLQAMTGTVYLVKKLVASEKAEDKKEAVGLLSTFDDMIQYMDKIVSDLQDYARPVGADLVETSLPDLVRATVSSVKIPGNVQVTVDIHDGSMNLKLDTTLFRRLLTNLILNAVQAMPNGGKMTITCSSGDEAITVEVQDTGVGIAPENLGKIFNPFFTTKAQGQGLGLAVCKRLVEAQNGTITVTSEFGKGSAFTLKIPTNRKPVT